MLIGKFKKCLASHIDKSSLNNVLFKPISMLLSFIYTPLLMNCLGKETYGVWVTILSIINWITNFDFGIGNGLRNILPKALSEESYDYAQKQVSTALIVMSRLVLIINCIAVAIVLLIDIDNIIVSSESVRTPLIISITFICINFVLGLLNTLLYSIQKSELVSARNCVSQLLNIIGVVFLSKNKIGSLVNVSIVFGLSSSLTYICGLFILCNIREYFRPKVKLYDKKIVPLISDVGIKFFVIQVSCLIMYSTDNILIKILFGGEAVAIYDICNKPFEAVQGILLAFIAPYWSKTTYIIEKRDFGSLKRMIIRLNAFVIAYSSIYIILCTNLERIAFLWIGEKIIFPQGLAKVMCVYYICYSIMAVNSQFINGTGKINIQLVTMVVVSVINIPLSIYMADKMNLGVTGIKLATDVLVMLPMIILPTNLYYIIRNLKKNG